jgi:hypothetical protein
MANQDVQITMEHFLQANEDFPVIERGEGVYLFDVDGRRLTAGLPSGPEEFPLVSRPSPVLDYPPVACVQAHLQSNDRKEKWT